MKSLAQSSFQQYLKAMLVWPVGVALHTTTTSIKVSGPGYFACSGSVQQVNRVGYIRDPTRLLVECVVM